MKKIWSVFVIMLMCSTLFGQTSIWTHDFESEGGYSTSVDEFSDGSYDYFLRTDGSGIGGESFSNQQGTYYFAAQDIDGEGASLPVTLTFDNISIAGFSSLKFSIFLAEDDASDDKNDWDKSDSVHILYDIDNSGTFSNLIWIENDGSTYNSVPSIDTDFDGTGDGTEITSTFSEFTESISGTGSLIDIQIKFVLDAGDEDIAIDNLEITGKSSGNTPPSITNITQTPTTVQSTSTVSISADVTDSEGSVSTVVCNWGTTSGSLGNQINMTASGDTYTTNSDISAQTAGTTVYYEIVATDDESAETTKGEYNYTVQDPAMTTLPYSETFDSDLGDCYTYSTSGDTKEWSFDSEAACANGYGSSETEEDWLILPGINLDNYINEILTFDTQYNYGEDDDDNYLKLYYSLNYSGIGDPSDAIWIELSYTQPSSAETVTSAGDIDLSSINGTSVYIALKYHGTIDDYRKWIVDNISITGANPGVPQISNITTNPDRITSDDAVSVTADVTDDDDTISDVELRWGADADLTSYTAIAMSNTSGNTYTTTTDIPAQTDGTTIYYSVYVTDTDASNSTTSEIKNYTVSDPTIVTLPYEETFDSDLGEFSTYSVTGDQVWEWTNNGSPAGCAKMSGYVSSSETNANEDWIITPGLDMNSTSGEIMTFETSRNYYPMPLVLCYSNDYIEGENPNNYTWTDISDRATFSETDDWSWKHSGYIDLSDITGDAVYFAFKYTCTTTYEGTWEIDNLNIYENSSIIIYNESQSPSNIVQPNTEVTVSADIVYSLSDFSVELVWGNSTNSYPNSVTMTNASDNTYTGTIPGYSNGTSIYYQIQVEATDGTTSSTTENSYTVETYYSRAEGKTGDELKAALHDIIKDHFEYPYTSSSTDVWDILKESDRDPSNSDNVILIYTGESVDATQEYNSGSGWTREHVWAKSHGDFGTSEGAGTDCHHLRPCDVSVNSSRSNLDFDNGGTQHSEATGCYYDDDSWEPRDEVKGDVARMIFYMAVRYEGDVSGEPDLEIVNYVNSVGTSKLPYHGKLDALLEWHEEDPVDDFEINRNEVVYSYQENRNPFIDHPEYVEEIWGSDISLSVEMVDFTGSFSQGVVTLKWKTESEVNNLGFNVYRSADNEDNYEKINETIIEGQGNSSSATSYEFSDSEVISSRVYYYKIEDMSSDGKTKMHSSISIETTKDESKLVDSFELNKAYPNPFNPETTISYNVPTNSFVNIRIYNIQGQLIRTLVSESMTAGMYKVIWNGLDNNNSMVGNGVYFYNMTTNTGFSKTAKVIFLK